MHTIDVFPYGDPYEENNEDGRKSNNRQKVLYKNFILFSHVFTDRLKRELPTVTSVETFFSTEELLQRFPEQKDIHKLGEAILTGKINYGIVSNQLFFTFPVLEEKKNILIYAANADIIFLQRLKWEWLEYVCDRLTHEFLLFCNANLDLQTGLPNLAYLQTTLTALCFERSSHSEYDNPTATNEEKGPAENGIYLALIELPNKRNDFQRSHYELMNGVRSLRHFVRDDGSLYYIGQRTFALLFLWGSKFSHSESQTFENTLLTYLKREGVYQVHIGSSCRTEELYGNFQQNTSRNTCPNQYAKRLLNEAWTALLQAEKRGPFSFCRYFNFAHPEHHQLAHVPKKLHESMARCWRTHNNFALVLLETDGNYPLPPLDHWLKNIPHFFTENTHGVYLFYEGVNTAKMYNEIKNIVNKWRDCQESFSAGIALYPYSNFKKSELPINCKKALAHATFFGNSSIVTFDQTSLNISGDIYYADGNFAGAITDYKRGLICGEKDVNLLNSLGVTLAFMNRLPAALENFSAALSLEPNNFMALYNKGLALRDIGKTEEAFNVLSQAIENISKEEQPRTERDLLLQLGLLGVNLAKYKETVAYLLRWLKISPTESRIGRAYKCLGLAYYHLGKLRQAMGYLQKAIPFDQFDAEVLATLGHTYLLAGEGEKSALTLCRKSVDIEPENVRNRLFLAEVLLACNELDAARRQILKCRRTRQFQIQIWQLLGDEARLQGRNRAAKKWYKRVLTKKAIDVSMQQKAEKGLSMLSK